MLVLDGVLTCDWCGSKGARKMVVDEVNVVTVVVRWVWRYEGFIAWPVDRCGICYVCIGLHATILTLERDWVAA